MGVISIPILPTMNDSFEGGGVGKKERHVICKNAPYLLPPPSILLRIMPFCCTFVTLRGGGGAKRR